MKSNMMQKRAAKQVKAAVSGETIEQAIQIASHLLNELPADDPRADAIAEIGDRLAAGSDDAEADVNQLAQFRRAIRGQRPTGQEEAVVEGSGSDNFAMNNEHPESVERHVEGASQGSNAFVTDRDEKGQPKAPETLEVPRIAAEKVAMKTDLTKKAAPVPAPVAAPANIFDAWTSDCLAAAIKAVTSTAEYASDKAAQQGVGMMNDALKNRPAMPEQQVTASAKKAGAGSGGFTAQNSDTGVIKDGDKSIPSSRDEEELQGLDKSGKITRPETVLPGKFAGDAGIKKLMGSLNLAGTE